MPTVKMPFIKAQVNYTEPCKVKMGVSRLADCDLQQDAATLVISSEGSKKARDYVNIAALKEEKAEYGDGETVEKVKTEKSFERLIDAALNGGELSQDEQERLDKELFGRIRMHYNEMQNLRLSDNDERILEELKSHFLMKQQALKDMRQAAADETQQARAAQQETEAAQNADEVANKAAEADMIAKSLEGLDQNTAAEAPEYEKASGGSISGMAGDNAVSGEEKAAEHQKRMNYDANNKDNIDEIDNQRLTEVMQEKEYSKMLDESYGRTMQVFENKEFTLKERAEAYSIFIDESRELAENREIARHLKIYDYESALDLRLKELSGYGKKNTVAQPREDHVQDTGRDFVRDAAADKLQMAKKSWEKNEGLAETKAVKDDRKIPGQPEVRCLR